MRDVDEQAKLATQMMQNIKTLTELATEIHTCTDAARCADLARQIDEYTAISHTLLRRAEQLQGKAPAPPADIPGLDLLWAERLKVCNELLEALGNVGILRTKILPGCADDVERSNVQKVIDEGEAECRRLGDRLLQIAASQSALADKAGPRSA